MMTTDPRQPQREVRLPGPKTAGGTGQAPVLPVSSRCQPRVRAAGKARSTAPVVRRGVLVSLHGPVRAVNPRDRLVLLAAQDDSWGAR